MAVILSVFISFLLVVRVLHIAFSEASYRNRYRHWRCAVHHTNRGWQACGFYNIMKRLVLLLLIGLDAIPSQWSPVPEVSCMRAKRGFKHYDLLPFHFHQP